MDEPTAKKTGHILFRGSSMENPTLEESYLDGMTAAYKPGTPMYNRYVLGGFDEFEGLVLMGFDPDTMIAPWPDELFIHKVAGVDFGAQSPTTVIETSMTLSRRRWLREWLYKRDCDDETLVRACRDAMDDGVTRFLCDKSDPARISWMKRQGIPAAENASNRIEQRVKAWLTPISEDRLTIDSGSPFLIREVTGLSWATRKGREMETDHFRQGDPDHAFDGGANGLMHLEKAVPKGMVAPDVRISL